MLLALGFEPCEVAPCIYVKVVPTGILVIGHFVDDLILCNLSSDPHAFDDVRVAVSKHYTVMYADNGEKLVGAQFTVTDIGVFERWTQYCGDLEEPRPRSRLH